MAGILRNCGTHGNNYLVSFLVVGSKELCCKLSEVLHVHAKERKWNIAIHRCESIADVVQLNHNLRIDFIIFLFDSQTFQSLLEIETSISLISEHFIISGALCMVNCNGTSHTMGLTSYTSMKIREKYNIRFMCANFSKPQVCIQLAHRILNLAEAILGITSGIPVLGLSV